MSSRGRVVVADDHPVYRFGLVTALRAAGFDIVGEAGSGSELVRVSLETKPDVVLSDVRMPYGDGLEACRRLNEASWHGAVVFLTTYDEPAIVLRARRAGARAFLAKDAPMSDIVAVLDGILASPSFVVFPAADVPELTGREFDVLRSIATGATLPEVASQLGIAVSTAKDYLAALYDKLGVHDRVAAVNVARRLGLVDPADFG
jgi:two-component system, NarL family, nitrate/nitrite response regulator NarL